MKTKSLFALVTLLAVVTGLSAATPDLTYLHHFGPTPSDGYWLNPLVAGRDGALYGTTIRGGAANQGTIYRLDTNSGAHTVLFAFPTNSANGTQPGGPLIDGSDGLLYGWTTLGGTSNQGVIFRLDRTGSNYTVLRHLSQANPFNNGIRVSPTGAGAMIEASDGRLYLIPHSDEIARMDRDGGNYTVISTNAAVLGRRDTSNRRVSAPEDGHTPPIASAGAAAQAMAKVSGRPKSPAILF